MLVLLLLFYERSRCRHTRSALFGYRKSKNRRIFFLLSLLFFFCRKASKNCQKLPLLLKGQKKRPFFCTHFKLKLFYNKYRRRRTPSFRQIFSLGGGESVAVLSMGKRVARGEGTGSRSRYLRKIENKKTKRKEIYFYDH